MALQPNNCSVCGKDSVGDALFCAFCGAEFEKPTAVADSIESVTDEADPEFLAKLREVLGDEYQLLEQIGSGGFAHVHKARDRRLDRIVALKIMRPEFARDPAFAERFRREGKALAKLRHPGVVTIYDIRESGDLIYYVMPFAAGPNLRERLEDLGKLPPVEVHRILIDLCDAIGAAHLAGIIHRDVKPDNVVLEGRLEKPLLVDFGIAKAIENYGEDLTEQGVLVGTPAYMSPEQSAGEKIDHRTDIYSLGVLAYRLLTGKLPFDGSTSQAILSQHISDAATPVRVLNPAVPSKLADAVMKCMAKDPAERFQSAQELASALALVKFLPAPITERLPQNPKRDLQVGAVVGAIAIVLGFSIGRASNQTGGGANIPEVTPPTEAAADVLFNAFFAHTSTLGADHRADTERWLAHDLFADDASVVLVQATSSPPSLQRMEPWHLLTDRELTIRFASLDMTLATRRSWAGRQEQTMSWGDSSSACGTIDITAAIVEETWKIVELRMSDFGGSCPSPEL